MKHRTRRKTSPQVVPVRRKFQTRDHHAKMPARTEDLAADAFPQLQARTAPQPTADDRTDGADDAKAAPNLGRTA
jgi:hypothetical protein